MKKLSVCLLSLMCLAARSPASEAVKLIASNHRPAPQVRNLSRPRPGLMCGEVRWLAPSVRYGSWWPFHIINGRAEVGEFYPEVWTKAPYPGQQAFERAHRPCGKL